MALYYVLVPRTPEGPAEEKDGKKKRKNRRGKKRRKAAQGQISAGGGDVEGADFSGSDSALDEEGAFGDHGGDEDLDPERSGEDDEDIESWPNEEDIEMTDLQSGMNADTSFDVNIVIRNKPGDHGQD